MALDAAKAKQNISDVKAAMKKAASKDQAGNPKWVGFAFSPGKDPKDHIFMMHRQKKGNALSKLVLKDGGADRKVCYGEATVGKLGGKRVVWVEYLKRLPGAEKKITESLKLMHLPFIAKVRADEDPAQAPKPPAPVGEADEDQDEGTDSGAPDQDEDDGSFDAMMAEGDDTEGEEAEGDEGGDTGAGTDAAAPAADDAGAPAPEEAAQPEADAPAEPEAADAAAGGGDDAPPPPRVDPRLDNGAKTWDKARALMHGNINKFKEAVRNEYQSEHPDLLAEIDKGLGQVDRIMQTFDTRLTTAFQAAHGASDLNAQNEALKNARKVLGDYLKYMQSEPLIEHLDKNPFGVPTNLKVILSKTLTSLAAVTK